jgi:hypothetical protein
VFGHAGGFSANIDLSSLDGSNGFKLSGEAVYDLSGRSVASAGDVNGDGFADVIIGAYGASPHGTFSGASYVVFGHAGGFAANIDLSSLDGSKGFKLSGEATKNYTGNSVASAGDVNGDGFADLVIGAYLADAHGHYSGASYVVFGHAGGFSANIDLSSLDGSNGFKLSGEAAVDVSGCSVASAGDVNGDGFADVIIGAYGADPHGTFSGASYVVFGHAGGFAANVDLSSLDGSDGFKLSGVAASDFTGRKVASAGDVNGDGFADIIMGASGADPNGLSSGASYVVFGHAGGFAANIDLSSLNGRNGVLLNGVAAGDGNGWVASAGDLNGDGFADVAVGAFNADPHGLSSGASYVVFGYGTNEAPVIVSNGGGDTAIVPVAENTTAATTVQATDVDSPTLTFSIAGGADHNNSYIVQVFVSDGHVRSSLSDTQTLAVNVTDVPDVVHTDSGFHGDLGGDHKSDLLIRNAAGAVTLWQMNGGAIQSQPSVGTVGSEWHIESSADLGGDGKADILWRGNDGTVTLWQMNGAQITSNTAIGKSGSEWHINGTGDFNGDGKSDILWRADSGAVTLWQMNGAQIQANQAIGNSGAEWHVAGLGDFNGDGKSDTLWRADDGRIAIWQMNGNQITANVNVGKIGAEQHVAGVGDFNGDGKSDILFRADNGTLSAWQMNGGQIQSNQTIGAVGPEWHVYGTADLDGDNKADIVFRHTDGTVTAWEMNGAQIAAQLTISPLAIASDLGVHHYDLV